MISQVVRNLEFKSFGIEEGLSQNTVYDITETDNGILWLATIDGLNRFDGKSFKKFKSDTGNHGEIGAVFTSVEKLNDNILLLGTANGIICFDTNKLIFKTINEVFSNFQYSPKGFVHDLLVEDESTLYISKEDSLFVYNYKQNTFYTKKLESSIKHFTIDEKGNVYGQTDQTIYRIENFKATKIDINWGEVSKEKIKAVAFSSIGNFIALKGYPILRFSFVNNILNIEQTDIKLQAAFSSLHVSKDEKLWIGTRDNGVFLFDPKNNELKSSLKGINNKLHSTFILCFYESQDNTIYTGTSGGGFGINLNKVQQIKHIKSVSKIGEKPTDNMVFGLTKVDNDNIFYGGLFGGIKMYNFSSEKIQGYHNNHLPKEAMNMYDFEIINNDMFIASWYGLLKFTKDKKILALNTLVNDHDKLYSLQKKSDCELFIGGENGLAIYNLEDLSFNQVPCKNCKIQMEDLIVRYMSRINDNKLLIATSNHSLVMYDIENEKLQDFVALKSFSRSARHFYIDEEKLFLATDNGLLLLDKSFAIIKSWTKENGLANDFVYAVLKDNIGNAWLSTNFGIAKINIESEVVTNFNKLDGLQGYEFNTASAIKLDDDKLIFGGVNGLNVIKPSDFENPQSINAPLLNELNINQTKYPLSVLDQFSSIVLPYDSNYINIHFNNVDHWKKKQTYWYKMEGLDTTWFSNGYNTNINYSKLSPGKYHFQLKTEINSEFSKSINAISITITPAFWQTKLFKIFLILSCLTGVYFFSNHFVNKKTKQFENEKRLRVLEAKMMKYRMNPHFIFNTLNSLKHHALFKPKEQTAKFITEFSELIRGILDYNDKELIALNKDIQWTEKYINTENERQGNQTSLSIFIDPNLNTKAIYVPPFLLQAFIEEILWQRLFHQDKNRLLQINYNRIDQGFEITIEDNGTINNNIRSKIKYDGLQLAYERIEHFNKINKTQIKCLEEEILIKNESSRNRKRIQFIGLF